MQGHARRSALAPEARPPVRYGGLDRRQSFRVEVIPGLSVRLEGYDYVKLIEVSLRGCVLETKRRMETGLWNILEISYRHERTVLNIQAYQSFLHELFYSDEGDSRVAYRSRAVFFDPSIEALNLLYRIMRDYWSALEL